MTIRGVAVAGVVLCLCASAVCGADAVTVLNEGSYWRYHVTFRQPVIEGPGGGGLLSIKVSYRSYPGINTLQSDPPPAGWRAADFDDRAWPRARAVAGNRLASVAVTAFAPGAAFLTTQLSLRGRFEVTDPAAVKDMRLAVTYTGGAAVYLNGREIARQDLPARDLTADTRAVNRAGTGAGVLQSVAVPAEALRKGTNVLAVELHRCAYTQARGARVTVGLKALRLTCSGTGARPNIRRPTGIQVWAEDILDRVTALDYGDPNEAPAAIELAGARNGVFSGRVVVSSTEPIRGLKAVAGDLAAEGEGPGIPAERVTVRYAVLNGQAYGCPPWFDGLQGAPPAEVAINPAGKAALQPVWVTVAVPADARPGAYRGAVTLSADGLAPTTVPVHLTVADWRVPDPKAFRTYVGIYQSPTTLSIRYKAPEWSEKHWALMEKSFGLLGSVGNKIVNIPLSEQTQFGNDEGMVCWVRKADGSLAYDFSVFDRYIALTKKHFGIPDFVALHLWHSGGWEMRKADQKNTVTAIDKASGKRESIQVPVFGTAESKAFLKPVLDAIRSRLAAQGMEQAMCIGILSDGTAPPAVFRAFDEIIPGGARWTRGCHSVTRASAPYRILKGGAGTVVCHEFCYGMAMADPAKGLPPIHRQRSRPGVAYIRHSFDDNLSLLKYRNMAERALYCGTRGVGRVCLDYWNVPKGGRRGGANIYNRWPHSSCGQRSPNLWRLAWPGPDGPAATVRFVLLREGLQEAEAMIAVSEALSDHAPALGPELADDCKRIFIDRINYCRRLCPERYGQVYFRSNHYGWRDLSRRLYETAARVAAKRGGR